MNGDGTDKSPAATGTVTRESSSGGTVPDWRCAKVAQSQGQSLPRKLGSYSPCTFVGFVNEDGDR